MFFWWSWKNQGIPRIPFSEGLLLWVLIKLTRPKTILEIGTGSGYSTCWLLSGLTSKGKITTIEIDKKTQHIAKKNLLKYFPHSHQRVKWLLGDAKKVLTGIKDKHDLIFLDGKKGDYDQYFKLANKKLLNPRGIIVCDDVFWYQQHRNEIIHLSHQKDTKSIAQRLFYEKGEDSLQRFVTSLKKRADFHTILLNIGNGLSISKKKTSH